MNRETRPDPIIGPSPWRRRLAILVAIVGIAFVGGRLARDWPRSVTLAYDTDASRLDVDIVLDSEAMKSARFRQREGAQDPFEHKVSLPPGNYELRITTYDAEGQGVEHQRGLTVPADGTVRFDLRD